MPGIALPSGFLNAKGFSIGYAERSGIGSIGMPGGCYRFQRYVKVCGIGSICMPMGVGVALLRGFLNVGVQHWVCRGVWHKFHRYAKGSGIGSISMQKGMA